MKISILIPCHNEEKCIRRTIESCINQTRRADQILVVDDASTDRSVEIIEGFGQEVELLKLPVNKGNKSYVQQAGLERIDSDIFISTDADTVLDSRFIELVEKNFSERRVVAVAGYVKSLKHNWLTAARELDYLIGQEIHKAAQSNIDFLFVIPGCAGAFRTNFFKNCINFDHDTLTEDLDFTYKINKLGLKIRYERKAVVYTQDPADIFSYMNQMRRWYGGGWQNLRKHAGVMRRPAAALELAVSYGDGLVTSALLLLGPMFGFDFFAYLATTYFALILMLGLAGSIIRRRADLFFYSPSYVVLHFLNSYVFLEQMVKEIIMRKKNLYWFSPARR